MTDSPFFLSDAVVHALGWTLVHSMWQGTLAALLLWIALPRFRTAQGRYWAAYTALLLILAAALLTFGWMFEPPATAANATDIDAAALAGIVLSGGPVPEIPAPFWQKAAGWLETYYPAIVTVWLLGFGFFCIQLAGGMYYVQRLRRRYNQPVGHIWQEKLQALAAKVSYSRPVQLFESALVQTPVALGLFKPLILLPLGMINQISAAEVEAILAHELAHIARRDWLFNLVQALIDALFYFHPAVWWVSATIRAERENCCDDTAVALTGNRLVYAKTLVRLQDLAKTAKTPALALGMDGATRLLHRRPLLLERIKRILHQPQQSASLMEKMIATAILLALITLLTVRANTPPALAAAIRDIAVKPVEWLSGAPEPELAFQTPAADTVKPQHRQRIVHDDGDQHVEMELQDGKITSLKVDGKEIAESDFPKYQSLTDDLMRDATPPPPPPPAGWEFFAPPPPPGAPVAPLPPMGRLSRISTDKDGDGNTIIRLERDGEPTEIIVKNGEVWVDGKKVEEGETLDFPGDNQFFYWPGPDNKAFRIDGNHFFFPGADRELELPELLELNEAPEAPEAPERPELPEAPSIYRFDGNHFIFETPEGKVWEMPMPKISEEELKRVHEEALIEIKKQQKEIRKQLKSGEKEWKKQRKELEKEQLEQLRALDEARMSLERTKVAEREALMRAREEMSSAREAARAAQRDQVRVYRERRSAESVSQVLKEALIADKLIADPNSFSFELTGKELRVDGKKLSAEQHKKYLELYRQRTGKELDKKDSIRIEEEN